MMTFMKILHAKKNFFGDESKILCACAQSRGKMSDSSSGDEDPLLPRISVRCYGGGPYKAPVDDPPVVAKEALERRRGEEEAISLPGPSSRATKDALKRKRETALVGEGDI